MFFENLYRVNGLSGVLHVISSLLEDREVCHKDGIRILEMIRWGVVRKACV